ncbi:MAG: iron-containing redox enzyme family protein [Flavobacteriales bacterium]|nr:iron-containing redox enzyme family protein [Flavobacteriales bacterium]
MIDINKTNIINGKELIELLESNSISKHSFFQDEQNNHIGYISLILENGRELDITKFLARLIYQSDNLEIRAKLVPQLYDELGAGDYDKLHVHLIVKLLNAVKPHAILTERDANTLENAYQALDKIYRRLFNTENLYEGLGVAIANEIIVQPIFEYFKRIASSQNHNLNKDELEWILAHDELEEDHVKDSIDLANLLNQEQLNHAVAGAIELHNAIWSFFNELAKVKIQKEKS